METQALQKADAKAAVIKGERQDHGFSANTAASFFKPPVIQPKLDINEAGDEYEQEADKMADKVMRMPANKQPFFSPKPLSIYRLQRKCAACEEAEKQMQPKEANNITNLADASTVSYVTSLSGKGKTLAKEERNFFERRFGYDFSGVKIHNDAAAARSAQSVNAHAYTISNNIVFNKDKYAPGTEKGKRLLAHELTHTIQQNHGVISKKIQRDCFDRSNPSRNISACPEGATDVGRQAQGQSNTRDARANTIIATAQSTSLSLQDRAMQVLNDIICAYMPSQQSKVRRILYYAGEPGLYTQSVGAGASAQGDICVGDAFVNSTNNAGISRRVLQVAHELEHIGQYRSGMAGSNKHDEREFMAFTDEALADEFIGTGRMAHSTRRDLIDGTIGFYYCLSSALQTQYASRLQNLLDRRQTVNGTHGNPSTNPPSACRRLR